jgi:membrane protein implicated in regulation of membrane protease activity
VLDLGISLDVWPWVWMSVAVIFALIELTVLGGSFVLLPFAVSAFVASILGFYDVSVEIQWFVFVLGGAALFLGLYRWARTFVDQHAIAPGVGADRLVGLVGMVVSDISVDDTDRRGRVKVEGEEWGALAHDDVGIAAGTRVRVVAMQGTRVVVTPAEQRATPSTPPAPPTGPPTAPPSGSPSASTGHDPPTT